MDLISIGNQVGDIIPFFNGINAINYFIFVNRSISLIQRKIRYTSSEYSTFINSSESKKNPLERSGRLRAWNFAKGFK